MFNIFISVALLVLAFVCVLVVLFVLMQRPNANSGMGSALGGAATESVFGGETASVLSKATVVFITLFFLLCAGLYFGFLVKAKSDPNEVLPQAVPAVVVPEKSLITTETVPAKKPAENVPATK